MRKLKGKKQQEEDNKVAEQEETSLVMYIVSNVASKLHGSVAGQSARHMHAYTHIETHTWNLICQAKQIKE